MTDAIIPPHEVCSTELSLMKYIGYDKKRKGGKYESTVSDCSQFFWCTTCKKPVEVRMTQA